MSATGDTTVELRVPQESPSHIGAFFDSSEIRLRATGNAPDTRDARIERAKAWGWVSTTELAASPELEEAGLDIPEASVTDVRFLDALMKKPLLISGTLHASGRIEGSPSDRPC